MNIFTRAFKRWRQRAKGLSVLQSYERQQEKFREKYPNYVLGVGTYGFPTVHDANQGTTLRVGAYCSIASGVQIFLGHHHRTDWVSTYPFPAFFEEARHIPDFEVSRGDVTIGSDVWLCANCTILSGVTIGHGAVVATGSVVTRDVEPYAMVAGNPARVIRWRFDGETRQSLLQTEWWHWPVSEIKEITEILCSKNVDDLLTYSKNRINR